MKKKKKKEKEKKRAFVAIPLYHLTSQLRMNLIFFSDN